MHPIHYNVWGTDQKSDISDKMSNTGNNYCSDNLTVEMAFFVEFKF